MTTKESSERKGETSGLTYYGLLGTITQAVTVGVTSAVAVTITFVTIIALLAGGLWLAYALLPRTVFIILLVVIGADLLLGVVLRMIYSRR